jgi:hypothetical protein
MPRTGRRRVTEMVSHCLTTTIGTCLSTKAGANARQPGPDMAGAYGPTHVWECNGPVSRRGESCYSLLPLAGRRVVQAAARGGTEALSRRRPVGVCGLPVVLGNAGVRRQM